jgi:hypothetical protein
MPFETECYFLFISLRPPFYTVSFGSLLGYGNYVVSDVLSVYTKHIRFRSPSTVYLHLHGNVIKDFPCGILSVPLLNEYPRL